MCGFLLKPVDLSPYSSKMCSTERKWRYIQ
nr:MAG TPA: PLC-Y Phosphatidylinositol-specific phospholipase C, Y domain [Caudoviricetes sp.]DAM76251.1 MAG TPA: PLC-Y Phosphatidylinositol-specific phospholipase C, Y domain [Caudoviricetes sp.]DAT78612.1 MAG TPA: PLC-Y Phosphatidylinositol-specific phospholipase C, Y domain [Caudoviricetes sp.]DAU22597.1 MAG TPA: PLC-Y Phosphatidylinositol-specific phospholipase C, Y domain [Caudoviricetes sp.]DAV16809.1 MAG TPA: PLC-Y Phosphatidylinositol-specific phospholipase C, Y domain [Caudoviricetes s